MTNSTRYTDELHPCATYDDRLMAFLKDQGIANVANPEEEFEDEDTGEMVTVLSNGQTVIYDGRKFRLVDDQE